MQFFIVAHPLSVFWVKKILRKKNTHYYKRPLIIIQKSDLIFKRLK